MKRPADLNRLVKEIGMGLFDFAADLGKKLFGDDDDPSEKNTAAH